VRWKSLSLHLVLFAATIVTTLTVGASMSPDAVQKVRSGAELTLADLARAGLPYCATLLSILLVHELAHFIAARRHRVDATLPYFLPVPFEPIGTLGAFIRIRSPIPSRRAVLDIGAAGPIAGFVVALPLLFWGFAISEVKPVPPLPEGAVLQSPFAMLVRLIEGRPLQPMVEGPIVMGDSVITWLAARLTHGALPPQHDLHVNSIAYAAWLGMFVTSLNLLPIGQLDGGHVLHGLFGRHADRISRYLSYALLALGIFASWTWLAWWLLIRFVLGTRHPPATSQVPLDSARRAVGIAALVVLALTFVPIPFRF
jgi:membrane-associated protease RseP (regulator of RpoE activity)